MKLCKDKSKWQEENSEYKTFMHVVGDPNKLRKDLEQTYIKKLVSYGVLKEDAESILNSQKTERIGIQELKEEELPTIEAVNILQVSIFGSIVALQISIESGSKEEWKNLELSQYPSLEEVKALAINQPIQADHAEKALITLAEKTPNVSAFYSISQGDPVSFLSTDTIVKLSQLWQNLRVIVFNQYRGEPFLAFPNKLLIKEIKKNQ